MFGCLPYKGDIICSLNSARITTRIVYPLASKVDSFQTCPERWSSCLSAQLGQRGETRWGDGVRHGGGSLSWQARRPPCSGRWGAPGFTSPLCPSDVGDLARRDEHRLERGQPSPARTLQPVSASAERLGHLKSGESPKDEMAPQVTSGHSYMQDQDAWFSCRDSHWVLRGLRQEPSRLSPPFISPCPFCRDFLSVL